MRNLNNLKSLGAALSMVATVGCGDAGEVTTTMGEVRQKMEDICFEYAIASDRDYVVCPVRVDGDLKGYERFGCFSDRGQRSFLETDRAICNSPKTYSCFERSSDFGPITLSDDFVLDEPSYDLKRHTGENCTIQ